MNANESFNISLPFAGSPPGLVHIVLFDAYHTCLPFQRTSGQHSLARSPRAQLPESNENKLAAVSRRSRVCYQEPRESFRYGRLHF